MSNHERLAAAQRRLFFRMPSHKLTQKLGKSRGYVTLEDCDNGYAGDDVVVKVSALFGPKGIQFASCGR